MEVGQEIRRKREARGWSQTKLAAAADMAVSGVSQIETGARNPSAVTLAKLANALGVDVADFFPKTETPLPFEENGPKRQRSPFMETWTSYMLQRAREWEEALPKSARALRTCISRPPEGLQGLVEELSANPELAFKVLRRSELVQSEFAALSDAFLITMETIKDIDAPECEKSGTRFIRTDFREYRKAAVRLLDVEEKWSVAEKVARDVAGNTADLPEELAQSREKVERAAEGRRKVVALFERRQSA